MEPDKEILSKIVSEQVDKIRSEALEQIKHIQEQSERELSRVVPDLMKQIENFSVFKLLDVLDVIRNGGVVKTGECENRYNDTHWRLEIGGNIPFPMIRIRIGWLRVATGSLSSWRN